MRRWLEGAVREGDHLKTLCGLDSNFAEPDSDSNHVHIETNKAIKDSQVPALTFGCDEAGRKSIYSFTYEQAIYLHAMLYFTIDNRSMIQQPSHVNGGITRVSQGFSPSHLTAEKPRSCLARQEYRNHLADTHKRTSRAMCVAA